eukprot:UN34241
MGLTGICTNIVIVLLGVIAFQYFSDGEVLRLLSTNKSDSIGKYDSFYDRDAETSLDHKDQEGTNLYYNVATDFYEYGWGTSFHFGWGTVYETRMEVIKQLEHFIAMKLSMKEDMKVLDLGCGVGGPLRNIVSFTGSDVTGVTINEYQVERANKVSAGLSEFLQSKSHFVQGDFTKIPFPDNSFDAIYTIEAMVHKKDRSEAFAEAYRVLKPGGLFLNVDWLMTDKYDPNNREE